MMMIIGSVMLEMIYWGALTAHGNSSHAQVTSSIESLFDATIIIGSDDPCRRPPSLTAIGQETV